MKPTINRRTFLQQTGTALAGAALSPSFLIHQDHSMPKPIQVKRVNSNFEREPLQRPFGFKGGAITNVWQTVAYLENPSGTGKTGLGTQSVLWSDARVFANHTEEGGNALMYAMGERALQIVAGQSFTDPISLLDDLLPEVFEYGKKITGQPDLRQTFALNALVGLDNAAWLLYAEENGYTNFDEMLPPAYRPGLSARHDKVASIPALGYGTSVEEIRQLAGQGFFIMKIKIGAPGDQQTMLEKDKAFLKAIHDTLAHHETPHTPDGKIPYYFDANGRYDQKDTLHRFLDYAEKIGALEQIAVLEEPFGERNQEAVHDIAERGPRVAADESAHTDKDALGRIQQGYNTIAVKAVAKTLSMTLKIAQAAYEHKVPCFCADLTVNPILVEWNKNVAARLPAFPGLNFGLQETNGWQNYRNWEKMMEHHPFPEAAWTQSVNGVYPTNEDFFEKSGGIFEESKHYKKLVT
jgi:L-alanine-DL-glutamate epimerase-like enolase superfamily enzyme